MQSSLTKWQSRLQFSPVNSMEIAHANCYSLKNPFKLILLLFAYLNVLWAFPVNWIRLWFPFMWGQLILLNPRFITQFRERIYAAWISDNWCEAPRTLGKRFVYEYIKRLPMLYLVTELNLNLCKATTVHLLSKCLFILILRFIYFNLVELYLPDSWELIMCVDSDSLSLSLLEIYLMFSSFNIGITGIGYYSCSIFGLCTTTYRSSNSPRKR